MQIVVCPTLLALVNYTVKKSEKRMIKIQVKKRMFYLKVLLYS